MQELCRGARADDEDEVYACRMIENYLTELHTSRNSLEFQTKTLDRDLWALSAAKMQAVTAASPVDSLVCGMADSSPLWSKGKGRIL